jgi:alkylhydroperoxidase/carboxymuconolactone decarboxylase family protein YurZ
VEGARILGLNQTTPTESKEEKSLSPDNTEEILAYFKQIFGSVPSFVQLLAEKQPDLLDVYYKGRNELLKDDVLPRKYKELLLVGLNAAERYHFGMESHGKGALASGATHEELLEAMTTSILGGGIPAWAEAAAVYLKVTHKKLTLKHSLVSPLYTLSLAPHRETSCRSQYEHFTTSHLLVV